MKLKLLIAVIAASFSLSSFAGLLIDPYIGAGTHKTTFDLNTDVDDSSDNLSTVGSRVGLSFLLLSAGIDYEMQKVDGDAVTNMSVFVGVDLPVLLRFWGEYFLSSDVEDADYEFKNGYAVGVGFTGLPFVSLNLELQNINYELDESPLKGDVAAAATVFSVSLPIDL